MANARFNSSLIDEGGARPTSGRSLPRTLLAGAVMIIVGVIVVWAMFLLLASL